MLWAIRAGKLEDSGTFAVINIAGSLKSLLFLPQV